MNMAKSRRPSSSGLALGNLFELAEAKLQESFCDAVGVVAEDVAFVDEVAGDGFYAEGADAVEVGLDGELAFAGVLFEQRG